MSAVVWVDSMIHLLVLEITTAAARCSDSRRLIDAGTPRFQLGFYFLLVLVVRTAGARSQGPREPDWKTHRQHMRLSDRSKCVFFARSTISSHEMRLRRGKHRHVLKAGLIAHQVSVSNLSVLFSFFRNARGGGLQFLNVE